MTSVSIDVIIAAAGSGSRLGAAAPKAFVPIDGVPLLCHALAAAAKIGARRTVVTVPASDAATWIDRVRELAGDQPVQAVAGGETRQDSVRLGLLALQQAVEPVGSDTQHVVLVHDAARPLATVDLWRRVADEAARAGGAVPVVATVDSLKEVDDGSIVAAVDRGRIMRAQTPQGFRFDELLEAHLAAQASGTEVTDDAALFELAGRRVAAVPGEGANVKVTTPEDLDAVARVLRGGDGAAVRVGYGYDIHPLVEGRRLVLGGVEIDYERGLDGHSDADALAHAVTDALLGAAGLGDIGQKFPAEDARWKDADSMELLASVAADLSSAGFAPHNVDATILAERPRLVAHLEAMRSRIAACLGLSPGAVNVKATRGEGMGPIGRGEGIAAHAVVTITKV